MKNALSLLVICLNISLVSCAQDYGHRNPTYVPYAPEKSFCIANGDGTAQCYDSRKWPNKFKTPIKNYICTSPDENNQHEEWVRSVLDACEGK